LNSFPSRIESNKTKNQKNDATSKSILADLEAGHSVICDRYAFSGIAFSAAKVSILFSSINPLQAKKNDLKWNRDYPIPGVVHPI
jgi:thymidylate kinase